MSFCSKCGIQLNDNVKFCSGCGNNVSGDALSDLKKSITSGIPFSLSSKNNLLYATVIVAAINAVLPFFNWISVPILNAFSSWVGGGSNAASYSLFGYIFATGQFSSSGGTAIFILLLAILAFVGVIFNALFVYKTLAKKDKNYKYGTMGSIVLLIVTALFIVVVGLISAILKVIELTAAPWFALVFSIANLVLVKRLKKNQSMESGSI